MPLLTVSKDARHRTKQELAYATLRQAIMRCELQPGERLVIDDLARRLSVSAIPVREALQLLQSEGLVVVVPHVGATVAPISPESILEVFTVLEGLESVASRAAVRRAREEDIAGLDRLVRAMDDALAAERHDDWADLNTRLHLTISRLAGMPMLLEMTERVLDRWDRVRRYFFSGVLAHRLEHAQAEHHEMVEAMRARDAGRLEGLIRRHNQGALASYTDYAAAARADAVRA
jgi:DNA-binding GntR family transcriptional regulator